MEPEIENGIILKGTKKQFYEFLNKGIKKTGKTVNFVIDPATTITYENCIEFTENQLTEDNINIFQSIKTEEILLSFIDKIIRYCVEQHERFEENTLRYIVYIMLNNQLSNSEALIRRFSEILKPLAMSIILLEDK